MNKATLQAIQKMLCTQPGGIVNPKIKLIDMTDVQFPIDKSINLHIAHGFAVRLKLIPAIPPDFVCIPGFPEEGERTYCSNLSLIDHAFLFKHPLENNIFITVRTYIAEPHIHYPTHPDDLDDEERKALSKEEYDEMAENSIKAMKLQTSRIRIGYYNIDEENNKIGYDERNKNFILRNDYKIYPFTSEF